MEPATVLGTPGAQAPAAGRNPGRVVVVALARHAGHDRVRFWAADHTTSAAPLPYRSLTERVLDDFGRLDVLANNLGNLSQERQITSHSRARR